MGKPRSQPDQSNQSSSTLGNNQPAASSINHFSHDQHPLQLSQHTVNGSLCSGCKLEVSGMIYSCTICNYFLHPKCSQMPQKITHPFDYQNHVLSLLPSPVYPEGLFSCDACGHQGNGFSYHCKVCGIDLHILCASSPMTFMHQYHQHQLQLTFSPPYPGKTFSCDICGMNGSNNWLYRCNICQFDVHLTCVNKQPSTNVHTQSFTQQFRMMTNQPTNPHLFPQNSLPKNFMSSVNPQPQLFSQHSMSNNFLSNAHPAAYNSFTPGGIPQAQPQVLGTPFAATTPMPNYGMPTNNFTRAGAYGPMRPAGNAQGNGLMNQVIGGVANGIASGASQAIAGALIQGLMGGGDGGNNGGGIDAGSAMDAGYGGGIDGGYGGGMDGGYVGDANNVSNY